MTQPTEPTGPPKGSVSLDSLLPPTGRKVLEPATPPPLVSGSGPIIPGMTPLDGEDIKKAETLSDLRFLFPELQRDGSETMMVVERNFPKVRNGVKVDGFVAKCYSTVNGHDVLSEVGFREAFGPGTYTVWVEGPSKKKVDPVTGMPAIIRKTNGEFKLSLSEVPQVTQQPMFGPGMFNGTNPAVELERVKGENALSQRVVDHALNQQNAGRPSADPMAAMAAEAIRGGNEMAQQTISQQAAQMAALQSHIYELQSKLSDSSSRATPTNDRMVEALLTRGYQDMEQVRSRYDDQIQRMRTDYEDRIERMRNSYEDRLKDKGDAVTKAEDRVRSDYDQKIERAVQLAEDRFRHERDHHLIVVEAAKKDYERNLATITNEHGREIEVLRNEAGRNLGNQERAFGVVIQSKDSEINRVTAEVAQLKSELERFRNKENKPLHVQLQEIKMMGDLVQSMAPQEKEEKSPSMGDRVMEALISPQGMQAAGPIIMALGQRAGVLPPAPPGQAPVAPAPALQPGQQPARQMGPARPQQQPQRPRGARNPVSTAEMPFRDPSVPPPPDAQRQDNVSPASPAQAATSAPKARQPVFKARPPFSKEEFDKHLPAIESAAFQAFQDRSDPAAFATLSIQFLNADTVSKFLSFVDGENFALLLEAATRGERGWAAEPRIQWMREVWAAMEDQITRPPAVPEPVVEPAAKA